MCYFIRKKLCYEWLDVNTVQSNRFFMCKKIVSEKLLRAVRLTWINWFGYTWVLFIINGIWFLPFISVSKMISVCLYRIELKVQMFTYYLFVFYHHFLG